MILATNSVNSIAMNSMINFQDTLQLAKKIFNMQLIFFQFLLVNGHTQNPTQGSLDISHYLIHHHPLYASQVVYPGEGVAHQHVLTTYLVSACREVGFDRLKPGCFFLKLTKLQIKI